MYSTEPWTRPASAARTPALKPDASTSPPFADEVVAELRGQSGRVDAEQRDHLIRDVLAEGAQRDGGRGNVALDLDFDVLRALGLQRPSGSSDENVRCGGSQMPPSIRGRNSSAPGATARLDTIVLTRK